MWAKTGQQTASFWVQLLPTPEWTPPHLKFALLGGQTFSINSDSVVGGLKVNNRQINRSKENKFYSHGCKCTWVKCTPSSPGYGGLYTNLMGAGVRMGSCGETNELLGEQIGGVTVLKMFVYGISHPVCVGERIYSCFTLGRLCFQSDTRKLLSPSAVSQMSSVCEYERVSVGPIETLLSI